MEFNMHNNRPNDTWEQANQTTLPPIGALIDATSVNDASNNVFTYRSGSPGPLGDYPVISGHFSNRPGSPLYSQAHIASPAPPSPSTRVASLYPPNVPFIPAPDNAQPLANQADVQVDGFAVAQFGQGRSVQQVQPAVSFTPAARGGQQGAIVPPQQRPRPRPRQSLTLPQDPFDYRSRAPSRSVVEPYQPQLAPTPPAHHVAQAAAPPVAPAVSQTTRTTSTSGARAHSIIPSIPDDSDVEDLGSTIPIPPTRSPSPTLSVPASTARARGKRSAAAAPASPSPVSQSTPAPKKRKAGSTPAAPSSSKPKPSRKNDGVQPAKKSGGRKPGATSFQESDVDKMLDLVAVVQPIGQKQWTLVSERFNVWAKQNGRQTRTPESIRKKYGKLVNTLKPTGEGTMPEPVRRAKEINERIEASIGMGEVIDRDIPPDWDNVGSDSEWDDERGDGAQDVDDSGEENEQSAVPVASTPVASRPSNGKQLAHNGRARNDPVAAGRQFLSVMADHFDPSASEARENRREQYRSERFGELGRLILHRADQQDAREARREVKQLQDEVNSLRRENLQLQLQVNQLQMQLMLAHAMPGATFPGFGHNGGGQQDQNAYGDAAQYMV